MFNQKLQEVQQDFSSFERHEKYPEVIRAKSDEEVYKLMANDIKEYQEQGYGSVSVICKTRSQTEALYEALKPMLNIKLVNSYEDEVEKGIVAIPAYMAKGMEFDVVLVHDASYENYHTELDKKLMYIACSRALHRLSLYHTGRVSPFLV
jgi:DNA helicase-2/ATP-dependent DNA helicase PcrA